MNDYYWGCESQIDLKHCNPETIRDRDKIELFVIQLCGLIKMKRYGECQIVHFGEEERVAGFSMYQLIETSNISAHFANETNNVYLNVFSCKAYDTKLVEEFATTFFEAESSIARVSYRL